MAQQDKIESLLRRQGLLLEGILTALNAQLMLAEHEHSFKGQSSQKELCTFTINAIELILRSK
jgi:hypothetical protein